MLGEARLCRSDLKAIDHLFAAHDIDAASSPDRLMETASHAFRAVAERWHRRFPSLAENR